MNESNRLLREYAELGSEAAFRELVQRYIDLVYSVAVRRSGGDVHRAEDIVQTVFSDLARKAADLPPNVQLGGWLHRHCCFVASTVHRTETRRQAREREAMDFLKTANAGGESNWEELAPILDEAIQELEEPEREAIVLRYFEKLDLRSVGQAFGTSEDAAQKRVSRALEKLRGILAGRGVALSATGLGGCLASQVVIAAPVGWAAKVGARALEQAALQSAKIGAGSGVLAMFLASSVFKVGGLVAGVALFVGALIWTGKRPDEVAARESKAGVETTAAGSLPETTRAEDPSPGGPEAAVGPGDPDDPNALRLVLVARETGLPVPGGQIDYRAWEGDRFSSRKLFTDEQGVCSTVIPRETLTDLELTTRIDGYADTRLKWWPKRGDNIPQSRTLKLERAVPISGRVVNEDGLPVAGAKVGFNHNESPIEAMQNESHLFSWIEVETDEEGRWRMDRIAGKMIRQLRGGAKHAEYVASEYLEVAQKAGAEEQLRAGTHVFTLRPAATVRGVVVDDSGLAIPGAKVLVGQRGYAGSRNTTTELNGSFEVTGCQPGKSLITAEAPQYAPTTIAVEISLTNSEPHTVVLNPGRILRMRVVNRAGQPVPRAHVWLNTMESARKPGEEMLLVQADFSPRTDEDGRVFWDRAPDRELSFDIQGKGYMRANGVKVYPDGREHVITLEPALRISGTVVDGGSGEPIPKFKVIAGWPQRKSPDDPAPRPHWSTIDRYWLSFADGKFEYAWEEPVIYGSGEVEYIFKIEAEGYAAHVTRIVNAKEENVQFDVRLEPAKNLLVTVLSPRGLPAANTDVVLATANQYIEVNARGFGRRDGILLTTDAKGQFPFSPDESIAKVFAANAEGFGQADPAVLLDEGAIQLQSWGRVEGAFTKRGKGVQGKGVTIDPFDLSHPTEPRLRLQDDPVTDENGRFAFMRVPPGKFKISTVVPNGDNSWSHVPFDTIEVRPGETTVVNHDESGAEVRVRLQWPADFKREAGQQVFGMMNTPFPQPPKEALGNMEALRAWQMLPEIQALAGKARHVPLRETEGGLWIGENVRPGSYMIGFSVVQPARDPEAGQPMLPVLTASLRVSVPDDAGEVLDLGVISLAPPAATPGN